jgi:hypothetical protein
MDILNTNKKKGIKCPMAGCGHLLHTNDVVVCHVHFWTKRMTDLVARSCTSETG